jgi:hypothetical protein
MRQRCAIWCTLLVILAAGCASSHSSSISWLERFRPFQGPTGPDVVQIDVALLQRPITDTYLRRDLWDLADEQAVPLETKITLEDNGFRVGQIGGLTPAGLQDLLTSKRSCVDPRRLYVRADRPTLLSLGPKMASSRFQIHKDTEAEAVSLDQAECLLSLVPILARDGTVKLRFTPQIQYGDKVIQPRPAQDQPGLILQSERSARSFSSLSWEVTMVPNQYAVIGARFDRRDTLGYCCFIRADDPAPVQRVLVVRANRASQLVPDDMQLSLDDPQPIKTPPLALQAAWSSARGSSN